MRIAALIMVTALCVLSAWSIVQPERFSGSPVHELPQFDWSHPCAQSVEACHAWSAATRTTTSSLWRSPLTWVFIAASFIVFGALVLLIVLVLGFAVCQESKRQRRSVIVRKEWT